MRWDRLFADLEGTADHVARSQVEALADELSDRTWGSTSWLDLLGGRVVLDVLGAGRVVGELRGRHQGLVRLGGAWGDVLVATAAVLEVVETERRAAEVGLVEGRLGWASALRRLRDADELVRVTGRDGRSVDGRVDVVGADFVRIAVGSGRRRVLLLDAVALVAPG